FETRLQIISSSPFSATESLNRTSSLRLERSLAIGRSYSYVTEDLAGNSFHTNFSAAAQSDPLLRAGIHKALSGGNRAPHFFRLDARSSGMADGVRATFTPAAWRAEIFDSAVPRFP